MKRPSDEKERKESPETPLLAAMEAQPTQAEGLDRLFEHYMGQVSVGSRGTFNRQEAAKLALELTGGSAGVYYWPSADNYAKNKAAWLRYSLILGNTTTGVLFLINATDQFLEHEFQEWSTPTDLADILQFPDKKGLFRKELKVLLGSATCAIPFAISAYFFPLPGCRGSCLGVAVTHSEASNTILHAISWGLILTPAFWYYRLPLLPFTWSYRKYKFSQLSEKEKQIVLLNQQIESIYQKYRDLLTEFYNKAVSKIFTDQVNAQIDNSPDRRKAIELIPQMKSIEGIAELAYGDTQESSEPIQPHSSRLWCLCHATHSLLLNGGAKFIGSIFMIAGTIGWIGNPFYLLSEDLDRSTAESIIFGILPAYSMGVLSAFYGSIFVDRFYRFLTTSWDDPRDKLPVEVKLYPKSFLLFTLINAYLSFFSYATAEALIDKIFGSAMWDAFRPHLQNNAYPAMQLLSFMALQDLFVLYARKMAASFGSDDNKILAQLQIQSSCIPQRIQQVKGDVLMSRLRECKEELLTHHLKINPEKLSQDIEYLSQLNDELEQLTNSPEGTPASRGNRSWCNFMEPSSGRSSKKIRLKNVTGSSLQYQSAP